MLLTSGNQKSPTDNQAGKRLQSGRRDFLLGFQCQKWLTWIGMGQHISSICKFISKAYWSYACADLGAVVCIQDMATHLSQTVLKWGIYEHGGSLVASLIPRQYCTHKHSTDGSHMTTNSSQPSAVSIANQYLAICQLISHTRSYKLALAK